MHNLQGLQAALSLVEEEEANQDLKWVLKYKAIVLNEAIYPSTVAYWFVQKCTCGKWVTMQQLQGKESKQSVNRAICTALPSFTSKVKGIDLLWMKYILLVYLFLF